MYGMTTTGAPAAGAAIAYTGMNAGAGLLTAFGLVMMGVALLALVRPANRKNMP